MVTRIEKFGAPWCGPCKALDKTLDKLENIDIVKYDVDEYPELITKMNIRNIPVLIFYNGDKEVERRTGAISLKEIKDIINK